MKKVYLVHGWGGNPEGDWYKWLIKELKKNGIEAIAPEMPETFKPTIKNWVGKLKEVCKLDKDTILIGHSIGCQTILRYLEQLDSKIKIKGVILVAGWINLTENTWDEDYTKEIAKEWLETPINFNKIKNMSSKFVIINSDNDPWVDLSDANIFENNLNAEKIILHNQGHITGEDGVNKFPLLLNKVMEI